MIESLKIFGLLIQLTIGGIMMPFEYIITKDTKHSERFINYSWDYFTKMLDEIESE